MIQARICESCGKTFDAKRDFGKYCSIKCKKKFYNSKRYHTPEKKEFIFPSLLIEFYQKYSQKG